MAWIWQTTIDSLTPVVPNNALNLYTGAGTGATAGNYVFFWIKGALKQAGWTVLDSGDGSSYFAGSDGITKATSGAGGMANSYAWFRIRSPAGAGGREYTMQRMTVHSEWRLKYSVTAGFTGGSPSATRTPSATDEAVYNGGGTDASPTGVAVFSSTTYEHRCHIGTNTSAPYEWYVMAPANGSASIGGLYGMYAYGVGLTETAAGDNDAWVNNIGYNTALNAANIQNVSYGVGFSWNRYGSLTPVYTRNVGLNVNAIQLLPVNPYTGKDETWSIACGRRASDSRGGFKGWLTGIRANMTSGRIIGDYQDEGAVRWAIFEGIAVPYSQSVIPFV